MIKIFPLILWLATPSNFKMPKYNDLIRAPEEVSLQLFAECHFQINAMSSDVRCVWGNVDILDMEIKDFSILIR